MIFDMDGVMIDSEPLYKVAWQKAAAECGCPFDEEFYDTLIGKRNSVCEEMIVQRFGRDFPLLEFRLLWSQIWRNLVDSSGIPLKKGLTEILAFLDAQRVPIAVATSTDREHTTLSLRATRLADRFVHVVTGEEVRRGKPAPDSYLEAARRLGVIPDRCVAIEDSDSGVFAATAAGMTTLMIPDLLTPSREAQDAAFCVVPSLLEAREHVISLMAAAGQLESKSGGPQEDA